MSRLGASSNGLRPCWPGCPVWPRLPAYGRHAALIGGMLGVPAIRREGGSVAGFGDPHSAWRKSSSSNKTDCAEVAVADGSVFVRDSAGRDGGVLRFPRAAWSAFVARTRALPLSGAGAARKPGRLGDERA